MKARQWFTIDRPTVDDVTTVADTYAIVPFTIENSTSTRNWWDTFHLQGTKTLRFSAATKDLKVTIYGSLDGATFPETVEAEFEVLTTTPVLKKISGYWAAIQVKVKPSASGQNGTLSTVAIGSSLASIMDIATMQDDIALMKASESSIDGKLATTYLGQDRTTTIGAAEELTIPANSKRVILSCGPSTQCYINLNADATTSSPLYFEDPFGPIILDLGSVTKLSAYVVAGNVGAVFYG